MGNPVRESNAAARLQYSISLSQGTFFVRDVKQRFLTYHNIDGGIRQWHLHNISFNDTNTFCNPT